MSSANTEFDCEDSTATFIVTVPWNDAKLERDCEWASKRNTYRCTFTNVTEHCPKSCLSDCADTESPSMMMHSLTPSLSSAPSMYCEDSILTFDIYTWYGVLHDKNCQWVREFTYRCTYDRRLVSLCSKTCDKTCSLRAAPTRAPYYTYPTHPAKNDSNMETFYAVMAVTIGIVFMSCFCICASRQGRQNQSEGQNVRSTRNRNGIDLNSEEAKHRRRMEILTNVIHKKVIDAKSMKKKQDDVFENNSQSSIVHSNSIVDQEHTVKGDIIINDSKKVTSAHDNQSLLSTCNTSFRRSIFQRKNQHSNSLSSFNSLQSFASSSSSLAGDGVFKRVLQFFPPQQQHRQRFSNRSISSLFSASTTTTTANNPTCSICMETYKDGEEIVWSKNDECLHVYHLDCMLNWLMEHDECPICRRDFLNIINTDDDEEI